MLNDWSDREPDAPPGWAARLPVYLVATIVATGTVALLVQIGMSIAAMIR
ncbi:MAG: hypothetical protein AB7E60_01955 [Sphingobium sp.]